jgi:hypothetical protein
LSDNLQAENRTITRILRVKVCLLVFFNLFLKKKQKQKDSKRDIEDTVFKQQSLFMKTEKNGAWTLVHFKLFAEDLAYYASEKDTERKGALSLKVVIVLHCSC